jgi:hypothetical protein
MSRAKYIYAFLQGGIGNQLFIYSAALQQSIRLEVPIEIDTSFYEAQVEKPSWNVTPRDFELGELNLPGKIISTESPWSGSSPQSKKQRILRRVLPPHHKVFIEQSTSYDPSINTVKPGTTLCGYFQAANYLDSSVHIVLRQLEEQYKLRDLQTNRSTTSKVVTFHIRRGDYLDSSRNPGQVITSWEYFEEAINRAREYFGQFRGLVYTDSPELIMEHLKKYPELELVDSAQMSSLDLLLNMADADGIAMSNSSLSWWAARLLQHLHSSDFVIAPRPWHGNGNPDEMYLPGWIIQDA